MTQVQKDYVRGAIIMAAAKLFADVGFEAASMSLVAERAGTSIGNLYKYFANKDELFAAVLPESFAKALREKTRRRVKAVGNVQDIRRLPVTAPYHVLADDLLDYCLGHRERVVILLGRAEGTPYATFAEDFVERLTTWAFEYIKRAWPNIVPSPALRFAVRRIYRSFVASMADTLANVRGETHVREAIFYLTAHHQGGLLHLLESAAARTRTS